MIYVKGPYPKPWDNYINISIGPIDVMKPFLKQIYQAKKRDYLIEKKDYYYGWFWFYWYQINRKNKESIQYLHNR